VDIGAIEFIHQQIVQLRDQGKAILLVSVELDEIMSLSDRIAVMFDGHIMGERVPSQTDEKELGLLMAGITQEPTAEDWQVVDQQFALQEEEHEGENNG
jgi:simple sugar transport system ATP-binding protein